MNSKDTGICKIEPIGVAISKNRYKRFNRENSKETENDGPCSVNLQKDHKVM